MSKSNNFKSAFTVIEMAVIIPIALIIITTIVTSMIVLNNRAIIMNKKTRKMAEINEALSIIEKDVALSDKFLPRVALFNHDNTEISATKDPSTNGKPFFSNSVKYGNIPHYNLGDHPNSTGVFKYNQPRLILNRIATITNPDEPDYLKKIAHFKQGPYGVSKCYYNNPVYYNIVYYVKGTGLYRRVVMHTKTDVDGHWEQDFSLYCEYTDAASNSIKEIPWQIPSCDREDFIDKKYPNYCKAEDQLLVDGVEMDLEYTSSLEAINNNIIHSKFENAKKRAIELNKAENVIVTLTHKQRNPNGDIDTIISSRVIGHKMARK